MIRIAVATAVVLALTGAAQASSLASLKSAARDATARAEAFNKEVRASAVPATRIAKAAGALKANLRDFQSELEGSQPDADALSQSLGAVQESRDFVAQAMEAKLPSAVRASWTGTLAAVDRLLAVATGEASPATNPRPAPPGPRRVVEKSLITAEDLPHLAADLAERVDELLARLARLPRGPFSRRAKDRLTDLLQMADAAAAAGEPGRLARAASTFPPQVSAVDAVLPKIAGYGRIQDEWAVCRRLALALEQYSR